MDFVSLEAENLADSVAACIQSDVLPNCDIKITISNDIGYTVPQYVSGTKDFNLSMRVKKPLKDCEIKIMQSGQLIKSVKFKKVIPAQMIKIPIKHTFMKSDKDLEVSIKC